MKLPEVDTWHTVECTGDKVTDNSSSVSSSWVLGIDITDEEFVSSSDDVDFDRIGPTLM